MNYYHGKRQIPKQIFETNKKTFNRTTSAKPKKVDLLGLGLYIRRVFVSAFLKKIKNRDNDLPKGEGSLMGVFEYLHNIEKSPTQK